MRTYSLKSRMGRGLGLAVATVLALSLFAVPASAEAVKGLASIAEGQRNPLAGTASAPFDITVTNVGVGVPTSYNHIVVVPPPGLFAAIDGSGPGDWQSFINKAGQVVFEGDTLSPGSSEVFRVTADVTRTSQDVARDWKVFVSDNAGQTLVLQEPAGPGALTTTIRVLQVLSAEITSPGGATDNSVTEQQDNTVIQTRIQNAGSQALTVDPSLQKASGSSSATVTDQGPASIASQGIGTFDFPVTFGDPGDIVFRADGAATGADAIDAHTAVISVLTRAEFSYIDDTLQPLHVAPGNPYSFTVNLEKTGQVGVNFDMANTRFEFADGAFSAPLDEPVGVGQGQQADTYQFASTLVSTDIPDDTYTPEILIAATDENGASVAGPVPITDQLELDRLIPVVIPELDPPDSQVEGEDDATTNGATLNFGGRVEKPEGDLCGSCSIVGAFLRQYGASGGQAGDIPVEVENNQGLLSGSYSGDYAPGAISVELHVSAISLALNEGTGVSDPRIDVDNIAPQAVAARTGGDGTERRRIDVFLGEKVAVPGKVKMSASDWSVDNHVVADADLRPSARGGDRVVLTLGTTLGQDEEPVVTYTPGSNGTRSHDRVGLTLADFAMTAVDRILPDLPAVEEVAGMEKQDGEFWTNQSSPTFTIGDVHAGHQVCLFEDVNGNGQIDGGDAQIVCGIAQGDTITLAPTASLGANRQLTVLARATDARGNQGPTADEILNLDMIAPLLASVAFQGTDVVLTFDEPLARGRNFATDYTIHGTEGGFPIQWKPNSVSGSDDTRTLSIQDSSYSADLVDSVEYEYLGANPADRYQDRAGNFLADYNQSV